jgi:hypothetical protein
MTDTLDAIAREMRKEAETPYSVQTCHSNTLKRWADRITALSNQGEGEVAAWMDSLLGEVSVPSEHAVGSDPAKNGYVPLYLHPAEADRRDAERYRWLRMQDWNSSPLCVLRDPKRVLTKGHGLGADCPSRDRLDAAIDAATQEQT